VAAAAEVEDDEYDCVAVDEYDDEVPASSP
jgi:hypothetical protein